MIAFKESNLWQDSCQNSISFPQLEGNIDTEVVVIGGGYTGLSAALHLAQEGTSVVLLEAQDIGYGGSGRNVGLVNAGLWLKPEEIIDRCGGKEGEKLLNFLSAAPSEVFQLISQYNIECEAIHNGTLHCADSSRGLADLHQRQEQWAKYGTQVDLLNEQSTQALVGSKKYAGALLDKRAGTIQPMSFAYGLARAADSLGVNIFCNSAVESIKRQKNRWQVQTRNGVVTSQKIISATGAYTQQPNNWSAPETSSLYYFQMATPPLSEAQLQRILPQSHAIWDTKTVLTSFRLNREGRLIIGSVGKLDAASYQSHKAWASRKLAQVFPELQNMSFTHEWFGRIALTGNNIPRVAQPHPDWLTVWGYNGRGIAPGTAFGRACAETILSEGSNHFPISISDYKNEKFVEIQSLGIEMGAMAYHTISSRF